MSNKTPKYFDGNNMLRHSDQNGMSLMNDDDTDTNNNMNSHRYLDNTHSQQNFVSSPNQQENGNEDMLNTLKQYQSNFMLNKTNKRKSQHQNDSDDEEMLEIEYDSQHRSKAQLPQPQNLPKPIHLESYNHFAPLESQHKNHNILLDDDNENDESCINHISNNERQNSNYNTIQTNNQQQQHKYNQRIANEYQSTVNQTHIANHPQEIFEDDSQLTVNNFSRSAYKSVATNSGMLKGSSELYVWGRNQNGQLGIEPSIKSVVKIPHMLKLDFQISQISCGKSHTALITTQGQLFTMGSNLKGQLGLGSSTIQYLSSPELVEALSMWKTQKVVCARNSTFALMQSQQSENEEQEQNQQYLFSWGSNKNGILGLGKLTTDNQYFPIKIVIDEENEENIEITEISAGRSHMGAIVKKRGSDDIESNCLYMWGGNNYGQLGLWNFEDRNMPTFVDSDFNPTNLSCGDSFTVVLSDQNILYSTGSNLQGQLGQGQSINKQNAFAQLSSQNLKLQPGHYIKQLQTSDYAAVILSNGEMYIWGPTPIGQFNSPQMLQDLIQNNIPIKDMSLGTSFGLIQDENLMSYQLGSLFQENKNTSNFQFLENMYFLKFQCGHDFVIASAIPNISNANNYSSHKQKSNTKQMVRSNTQSALQHHKNVIKRRQPSGNQQHLPQILSQSQANVKLFGQSTMNHSPSPLRISNNNTIDIGQQAFNGTYSNNKTIQFRQSTSMMPNNNGSLYQNQLNNRAQIHNMNQTMSIPPSSIAHLQHQNSQTQYNSRRGNERKHLDSCTPVRKDMTPTSTNNHHNTSTVRKQQNDLQHTPSQTNTPNNMRLRLQQQNSTNINQNQQLNHIQSYAASNADDLLSQTLINTPQHMRRTFAGQAQSSLLMTHQQQNNHLTATPPPFNNYVANTCNCGCGPHNNSHNPMCLSQSYAFNNNNFGGGMTQSLIFQTMDQHHTPHQFNQTQLNMQHYGISSGGHHNTNNMDILIREKQEIQHSMQVEIQRRLMQEKELQEAYRQLDTVNSQHQNNIHELTTMFDLTKRDNDSLMQQVEEQDQEIQSLKTQTQTKNEELATIRAMYEELQAKQNTIQRENEYLKTRVEVAQQFQSLSQNAQNNTTSISLDKLKELEDNLQRKSKEIYELTVQLGCLKEENTQLKKDVDEQTNDYQERLESQKMRAEAELQVMIEENDELRKENDEVKREVETVNQTFNDKISKIQVLEKEVERIGEELESKDDNIRIHKREIQILQSECDKLMAEIKKNEKQQQEDKDNAKYKKTSRQLSRTGSNISLQKNNKKALHLSTVICDNDQNNDNNVMDNGVLDIEDLRRAADEILKDKHVFKTSTNNLSQPQSKKSSNNIYHNHQHTQMQINPIETPMESQRDSSISQPVISAQVISQQHHQQQNYSRQSQSNYYHSSGLHSSQMTPKQMMYQQLKQSMGFGKDSRSISNREQGCLQVANTQRRKSTQANYSNQVKNLRSSKSGTNLKQNKTAVTSRISNTNNNNNMTAMNNNNMSSMNKTIDNTQQFNNNEGSKSIGATQRNSISNLGHTTNTKSPLNYSKRQQNITTHASQIKLSRHQQHGVVGGGGIVEIIDMHPLDTLLTESINSQHNNNNLNKHSNLNNKSPLRQNTNLNNSQSTNHLLQGSKSNKNNATSTIAPLSQMYQKHNLYHNNNNNQHDTGKNRFSNGTRDSAITNNNNNSKTYQKPMQIDENTTPSLTSMPKNDIKALTTKSSQIQSKSLIISTALGDNNNNMQSSNRTTVANTLNHTPKNIVMINANNSRQSTTAVMKDSTNQSALINQSNSNGSLVDMKHKLHDIQQNKQYLEKKIYEYERKLNELKGVSQHHNSSEKTQMQMTQSYNGGGNGKLNTLSAAILEKVLNQK